jgi:hypothetical protein
VTIIAFQKSGKIYIILNSLLTIWPARYQDQTTIIFSLAVVMDTMRTQVFFPIFALLLCSVLASGCMNLVPGDVAYKSGSLTFTIRSEEAIPDGVLEVAIFRLQDFNQVELSRNADNYPLKAGDNEVTIPIALPGGNYRCFIYISSGNTRFPVVIRDFEI